MILIVVLTSLVAIVIGLAVGAVVAARAVRRHHGALAQRQQDLADQQVQAQLDAQAAAVDAAVRQVLAEREATATATALADSACSGPMMIRAPSPTASIAAACARAALPAVL